jgi:hypothetical protein
MMMQQYGCAHTQLRFFLYGVLQSATGDAISGSEECYNRFYFILLEPTIGFVADFYLLETVFCFATIGGFICYYRR